MRRLVIGLVLTVLSSGVLAEDPAKPVKPDATKSDSTNSESTKSDSTKGDSTKTDSEKSDSTKAAPGKEAAKKKKPKGPPAKELFGTVATPTPPMAARSIGSYAKGCLSGGVSLPINGPDWQVMRLSRNRNWGNPRLLDYLERLASDARALDGWPGLLIGDMSQPRGGPMITGHTSHQIGLDVDIWLTPMPDKILTPEEREETTAESMLKDPFNVDPEKFTPLQVKLIKRAASYPQVERIFVHPAIKKALCEQTAKDKNRAWIGKVRPWWNHFYHFHVRLSCPPGAEGCEGQKPVAGDDGCGKELDTWFGMLRSAELANGGAQAKPEPPTASGKASRLSLSDLPAECKAVLAAGGNVPVIEDGHVPAALKLEAGKDAGPPIPHLTVEQVQALKTKKGGTQTASGDVPLPDRNPKR